MKKFKLLPLALILTMLFPVLSVSAAAATEPEISATSAIVVSASTDEVYYAKNADQTVQPASTTKMMTALLVAEAVERGEISLSDEVTAYSDCQYNMDELSSHANPAIEPGETLTVEDLLYCSMLVSANEACNILAEYVSGSINSFVNAMNIRAQELGCTGTHFSNTNGIEESNHYTTASDFAIIAREALKSALFSQVCGAQSYTVPATNYQDQRELKNSNFLLLPDSDYYYEYAYGVKTGFFTNAGYCLVSAANKDEIDVICAVFGSVDRDSSFSETLALYDWMFSSYESRLILDTAKVVTTVDVALGTSDSTGVRAQSSIAAILPTSYDAGNVKYQVTFYHEQEGRELEAPVNAGDVLGEVTAVELDADGNVTRNFGSTMLVAANTVEMSRMEYLRTQISDLFKTPVVRRIVTVLIILLVIYLLLVVFYYVQRIRHLRSLREAKRERARRVAEYESQWLDIPGHESERSNRLEEYYDDGQYYDEQYDDYYDDNY